MKWEVKWKPEAERKLNEIWLDSTARDRLTAATYPLDEMLAADPENVGESRYENRRIVFVPRWGRFSRSIRLFAWSWSFPCPIIGNDFDQRAILHITAKATLSASGLPYLAQS